MRLAKCVTAVVLLATCVLAPRFALAHAVLVASTPKSGDTVSTGPLTVDLKFNSRVDAPHSTLSLTSPDGTEQPLPAGTQIAPDEIRTNTSGLAPGSYTLRWQALSSDGHMTRGQIAFKVK